MERTKWSSVRRRPVVLVAVLLTGAVGLALAGCGPRAADRDGTRSASVVLVDATPDGFRLDAVTHAPPSSLGPLMVDRTVPLTVTTAVYRANAAPARTITATLAGYDDPVGASAMYNRWFAENAFMASADRNALDIGDQAECFDVQWPPFHAVIARRERLFALVEADTTVPLPQCRALVRDLIEAWATP